MLKAAAVLIGGFALIGATVPLDAPPADPAAAIALAAKAKNGQATGLFRMKVAAVGQSKKITFLNSNADYRSEGNVTFSLSQAAARQLAEKTGLGDLRGLVGRDIVVAGRIERRAIVKLGADGRQIGINRYGYSVRVDKPEQLVSISAN